eukprot:2482950-Pyramimonas_sp.AAC.1
MEWKRYWSPGTMLDIGFASGGVLILVKRHLDGWVSPTMPCSLAPARLVRCFLRTSAWGTIAIYPIYVCDGVGLDL